MPVSFFQCLLLWSTFRMRKEYGHDQGTHQSDLGADGDVLVVPEEFWFGHCSSSLGYPGQYFRLGSLIRCYSSQIFKATESLQFLVVYGYVMRQCWCHWCYLSSAGSSLHWSACHVLWRPLQGDLPTWPARPSMSSAKRQFVIVLPQILTVPNHGLQVCQPLFSLRRCWRG